MAASGDHTADTAATSFPASTLSAADSLLTGVDVVTSPAASETYNATVGAGEPTVVVAGDNVTDNGGGNVTVAADKRAKRPHRG